MQSLLGIIVGLIISGINFWLGYVIYTKYNHPIPIAILGMMMVIVGLMISIFFQIYRG